MLSAIAIVSARFAMMILMKLLFCFLSGKGFFMFGNIKLIVSVLAICAGILLICCLIAECPVLLMQWSHTANRALV